MPKHPFICAIVSDNSAAEQIELCQHSISSPVRIITTESSKCIVATRRVIEEGAAVIVSRGSVALFPPFYSHQYKKGFSPHTHATDTHNML